MSRRQNFRVLKESGRSEPFSRKKLYRSLERTGLPKKTCEDISAKVAREVGEGSQTKDIYKKTLRLIKETSPVATIHYSLKKSLFDLGPEGHYFETFVAKYFEAIGFSTTTCLTLQGKFVKHEVDVIAEKNGEEHFCECKFHNHGGAKNDVKVVLYVKSRWDDLRDGPDGKKLRSFYIASNTSFTLDAITYAKGTGLKLLGVNMPEGDSFLDKIKALKLYPLTSLRRLPKHMKAELLRRNLVLAKEIPEHINLLRNLGMEEKEIMNLKDEIALLTKGQR